jgi:uncharacterized protein (TIGR02246 family)
MIRSRSTAQLASLLSVLIFLAACASEPQKPAPAPDTRKADEAAIRSASADWSKAAQAKDLDKIVGVYTDDAVYFVNNGALVKGKDNIKMSWQPMLGSPGTTLSWTTSYIEVARSGDLAYEYGTYSLVTEAKKGKPTEEKGKYVTVWRKQPDGSWKVAADIDNVGL